MLKRSLCLILALCLLLGTLPGAFADELCDHDYVAEEVPASCTEPAGTRYTCAKCGDTFFEPAQGLGPIDVQEVYDNLVITCPSKYTTNQSNAFYGKVEKITYYSKVANRNKQANVRFPLNYDENETYPVLYLLHGVMGSEEDMVESGKTIQNMVADGQAVNCFIVCPNMFSHPTMSSPSGINVESMAGYDKFIDDLVDSLMPYMKEHYPIKEGKENTSVCGFSMGGRESLAVGLFRPDLFGYIGAFSPAPGLVPGRDSPFGQQPMNHPGTFKPEEVNYDDREAPYLITISCGTADNVVCGTVDGQYYNWPKNYHNLYTQNNIAHVWWEIEGAGHGGSATTSGIYNFCRYVFKAEGSGSAPLGHDFGEWAASKAPTCTEKGEESRKCSRCEETETRETDALGHDYQLVVTEPSCTEGGSAEFVCTRCGDSQPGSETEPLGHDYAAVVTEPSCTENGFTTYTCSRCGDAYTGDETDALGHDFVDGVCTRCGEKEQAPVQISFTDVPENSWYTDAVTWAVVHGVTTGKSETSFDPTGDCTRGQVVTFLWRAAGKPSAEGGAKAARSGEAVRGAEPENPFTDVKTSAYYYDAVLWAVDRGITKGVSETSFAPGQSCTRGQVVTFLWRFAGEPEPISSSNPFSDVRQKEFYYSAVLWAVETGVTKGTSDTSFSPKQTCTRAQVVTFLYRACDEEYDGYISRLDKNGSYVRANDRQIYDGNLSEFSARMERANSATSNDERFALYAQAEAALLDSAVLLPTASKGGSYQLSRIAPRTVPYVKWGSDDDRLKGLVISDEFLTPTERDELLALWSKAVLGEGVYDPAAYLKSKGHSIQDSFNTDFISAPYSIDWLNTYSSAETEILVNFVDGLVEYNNLNQLQPALAESWEISPDGRTYTFHIRKGVKWYSSEGTAYAELTANDFVAGFRHMLDAHAGLEWMVDGVVVGAGAYTNGNGSWENVGCRATDDYTLVFTLERDVSYFMSMLGYSCFLPICDSFYRAHGGVYGVDALAETIGTEAYTFGKADDVSSQLYCGPFLLQKLDPEDEIVAAANPGYYNKQQVTLKSVRWIRDSGEPLERYAKAVGGVYAVQGLYAADGTLDRAKEDGSFDKYALITDTDSVTYFGGLNLNRGAFELESGTVKSPKTEQEKADTVTALNNKNFRKALLFAFDKASYNAAAVGEELAEASLRNMVSDPALVSLESDYTDAEGHTFPAGTFYGEMVQYYCDQSGAGVNVSDGVNGWYNPSAAKQYLAKAKKELAGAVSFPIRIDVVYYRESENITAQAAACKESIESCLGAGNVTVNLLAAESSEDFYQCGYRAGSGEAGNFDLFCGSGWAPDYGDPSTCLDIFLGGGTGYMTKVIGLF